MQRLIVLPDSICGGLSQGSGAAALAGHWQLDAGTMVMTISAGFCAILDIDRTSSLPFQSFLGMLHPDDRYRVESLVSIAPAETPTTFAEPIRIVHSDGGVKSVALKGETQTEADGHTVTLFGTVWQIADSGQGDAAPSDCAERERFRVYFEHSPEALFVVRLGAGGKLIPDCQQTSAPEMGGVAS